MKKVNMLQNPSLYLEQRNKALQDRAANTQKIYGEALHNVVTVAGTDNTKDPAYKATTNELWVKSLAPDIAAKIAAVDIAGVDLQFPILGSASQ